NARAGHNPTASPRERKLPCPSCVCDGVRFGGPTPSFQTAADLEVLMFRKLLVVPVLALMLTAFASVSNDYPLGDMSLCWNQRIPDGYYVVESVRDTNCPARPGHFYNAKLVRPF